MSEVIEFAKILRRELVEQSHPNWGWLTTVGIALDAAITEFESRGRKDVAVNADGRADASQALLNTPSEISGRESLPAPSTLDELRAEYRFDRYNRLGLMAQGIAVTREETLDKAIARAVGMSRPGDVLVLTNAVERIAALEAENARLDKENDSFGDAIGRWESTWEKEVDRANAAEHERAIAEARQPMPGSPWCIAEGCVKTALWCEDHGEEKTR